MTLIGRAGYFGKIPFEIRQKIYTYVLGNRLFGIAHFSNRRAVHGFIYRYSWKNNPLFPRKVSNAGNPPSSSEFSLLKTCRFIYIESVQVLYATNRFSFHNALLFTYSSFTRAVLPQRLACITLVDLSVLSGWFSLDKWTRLWNHAAIQLTGLRNVEVWLFEEDVVPRMDFSLDAKWVKPMLALKGLKAFYLNVQAMTGNSQFRWYSYYEQNVPISDDQNLEYFNKLEKLRNDLRERICA